MFLLATLFIFGLASAQKVTKLTFCSIDEHHLRLDCKYEPAAESPAVVCRYTQGGQVLDSTDPEEEQPAVYKARARARIFEGNNCRLRFNNLPEGRSNFTCNIKQTDTASKTCVVEKMLLLPCSALSVLLQSCSGPLLTLVMLSTLLQTGWL